MVKLQVGWSVEGLHRMERHGRLHLPALFHIQLEQYKSAGADCLQQVYSSSTSKNPGTRDTRSRNMCQALCTNHKAHMTHHAKQNPTVVIVPNGETHLFQLVTR